MTKDGPRIDDIFAAAMEMESAEERANYLDQACAGDTELRQRLERLLEAYFQAGSFLESPATALDVTHAQPISEQLGTIIGPYKLLEQIGEGGMGVVYMADQQTPVRRRVALKIIKPGMDTRQVIARFEAERQALALMDHANIARVLDAGSTDSGRPYFVMELVRGVPVTEYCDKNSLSVRDRLELFAAVCQAVQHAHQKGIIHRDIKPSNVLVTLVDGRPVPKVIDFGVAKAINQQLTEKTLFTNFAQMIGTPLYMSPEQAEMTSLDVDTRSDIYSLGVLLYELLTGTTPFDQKRIREAALDEIRRVIREEEPPKPSTRISTLGEERTVTAAHRRVDAHQLSQLLRGDLDWIVMKSIDKDRVRRYETANSLARDIERYLQHQPVEACPPSALYRFRKFARRNRVGLATVLLIAAALVVGTAISTWQAVRAEVARTAEAQQRNEAEKQRALAEENYEKARKAVDDYFNTVSESKLLEATGMEPLRQELLESALQYYDGFADQQTDDPERKADLVVAHLRVAMILYSNGEGPDRWSPHLVQAIEILEPIVQHGRDTPEVQRRMAGWFRSNVDPRNWRGGGIDDRAALDRGLRRYAEIWEKYVRDNPGAPEFQNDLAGIYFFICSNLWQGGKITEALTTSTRVVEIWEKLAHDYPHEPRFRLDLARVYEALGDVRGLQGMKDEGRKYRQKSLVLREQVVQEFPEIAGYRTQLGLAYSNAAGNAASPGNSEQFRRKAIEQFERVAAVYPTMHSARFDLAKEYRQLSSVLRQNGKDTEALNIGRKSVILLEALVAESPDHWNDRIECAASQRALASLLWANGQLDEAEATFHQSIESYLQTIREAPSNFRAKNEASAALGELSDFLRHLKRGDEALQISRQAVELQQRAVELAPRQTAQHYSNLGKLYADAKQDDEAIESFRRAIELDATFFWPHHHLADLLKKRGQDDEAIEQYRRAISLNPEFSWSHHNLADVLAKRAEDDEAIKHYRRAIILNSSFSWSHINLAGLLLKQGKLPEALTEAQAAERLAPLDANAAAMLQDVLRRIGDK
jgi:serine/threonine protein kinase/Tfp pilus assembly protein PilF